jgi:hypothetical protein
MNGDVTESKEKVKVSYLWRAVSRFRSVNRALKRGHISQFGTIYPKRPFNNRKDRPVENYKRKIYEQYKKSGKVEY